MFILLYKRTDAGVLDAFPKISDHFPKISKKFPKIAEDFRGRPRRCFDETSTNLGTV